MRRAKLSRRCAIFITALLLAQIRCDRHNVNVIFDLPVSSVGLSALTSSTTVRKIWKEFDFNVLLTTRQLSVRAPISKSRDASRVVVIHREVGGSSSNIVNSSVYPSSSLFSLLSLSCTWTRRERACFYDLLQNLREVKSCTTHSVRYAVCVRCDFTVRRATSRPHCNIIFRLSLGVCTEEPGLEYTCLPWRGWFGSSNDLKVRFSWLHFLCYLRRVTW